MRYICLASIVLLLCGCTKDFPVRDVNVETSAESDSCIPGIFRVKLADTAADLDTGAFTRNGGSGNLGFDMAAARVGATALEHVFSDGGRFKERRRKAGLHLWYNVHFDGCISVSEAIERFGVPEGVVCVEPIYRMVPTWENEPFCTTRAKTGSGIPFNDPLSSNQWYLLNDGSLRGSVAGADINAVPAWNISAGDHEVIVCVNDGGIDYTHPDLAANMWDDGEGHCGYNFNMHSYDITPSDHGTAVAGVIGAVNNNGVGICGIAGGDGSADSGVRMMSCQVFDAEGYTDIVELMTWTADHGAVISQNSWTYTGISDMSQAGKDAIEYFREYAGCDENGNQTGPMKGGVVIFAAGNENYDTPTFPAAYGPVISVASLGADFRKADHSNYGPWIDIAAPGGDDNDGGERYQIYTTALDGHYGFTSGTSLACPMVAGIAALAVAKYGGPGFTNEMLEELILNSGRREETELYNPQYIGQLGAGLIDGEYIFYHNEKPNPVTAVSSKGYGSRMELTWAVPSDYFGRPSPAFEIYVCNEAFTASSADEIPESAVRYRAENDGKAVGEEITFAVGSLESLTEYHCAIVSLSKYGTPSEPYIFKASTSDNTPPEVTVALPDIFLNSNDTAGITIPLDNYFHDADAPDDTVSYFVSFNGNGIVNGRLDGSELLLTPVNTGMATLSVIAQDQKGAKTSAPLRVTVDGTGAEVELFPNPCNERLNLRIPGATGNFRMEFRDRSGRYVYGASVAVGPEENGNTGWLNVSELNPGVYTCTVDYFGKSISHTIIKQ